MAQESRSKKLTKYRNRVTLARRWREQEGFDQRWRRMIDLYRGKHFPASLSPEDRIAVNIAFSTANVIYPSISVNHPKVTLEACAPEHEDQATIAEAWTNYAWRHYDFRTPFRLAVKDFIITGHGWVKQGWRYTEQQVPHDGPEFQQEFANQQAEADDFAQQNPDMAHLAPTDEEIEAAIPATRVDVTEDRPYAERVSVFDMFVDPEATNMDDLAWIAQRIVRPLDEVRTDPRYSPSARSKVQASRTSTDLSAYDDRSRREFGDDVQRAVVYEFYDLKTNMMCVFADSGDGFLVDPRPMPFPFGQPFVMLRNYDVPDQFYPMGDLEALEALQDELNKTRSQMMNHRKRYARKYLFNERSFGEAGRQALQSDEDNVFVPVADETKPLSEQVVPLQQIAVAPELYTYSETIEADMNTVSGVNEYARGDSPDIRRTATEAAIIQDAANARAADKLAVIENGITQVARRLVQLGQKFLSPDTVARIAGAQGQKLWVTFQPDDINGEFDFDVEAGSTQPMNETFRRQTAVAMAQTIMPLVGQVVDPSAFVSYLLQFGFGIKSPERFLMQQPPMAPPGAPQQPGGVPGMQPPPPGGDPTQQPPQTMIPPQLQQQLIGQGGFSPTVTADNAG